MKPECRERCPEVCSLAWKLGYELAQTPDIDAQTQSTAVAIEVLTRGCPGPTETEVSIPLRFAKLRGILGLIDAHTESQTVCQTPLNNTLQTG